MEGRVEQAHGDGQAVHGLEDLDEVLPLHPAQLLEGVVLLLGAVGQDHAAHHRQAVLAQEHVLGAAEADPLGAEPAGVGRVLAVVGVGPHAQVPLADLVGPRQERLELGGWVGLDEIHLPLDHGAQGAVEREPLPLGHHHAPHREVVGGDAQGLGPDHGRLAPTPGHHRGVAHQAAPGRQDPLGGQHSVDVLGRGLVAHQHHRLAPLGGGGGVVGGEVDPAHRRPRRGGQPPHQDLVAAAGELGVEHRGKVVLGDPPDGLGPGEPDGRLGRHVDGHLEGGPSGALAHPGLEHPELALLDGELGVAHVAVVPLEPFEDREQLLVDLGERGLEGRQRLGVADAGHDVLALGVHQEVAVGAAVPGGRVPGEPHPGPGLVVAVAEDHGLDVHRRAQGVRDPLALAIGNGPRPVPAAEDRLDGPAQLVRRVLGEGLAGVALDDLLVGVGQVAQELGGHLGVRAGPGELLGRLEQRVELLAGDVEHDPPVHGEEPAVGVVGEPLVAGLLGQALDRLVVETQVQDGVHHPGHGELGPRAHRDQQRVRRVAHRLAHRSLQPGACLGQLLGEPLGPARFHIGPAGVGGDGEARRDRQVQHRRHLGQVGPLAAEEVLHLHRRASVGVVEVEDVGHGGSTLPAVTALPEWSAVR